MPKLIVLVGPPGSGKSTLAKEYEAQGFVRISQDDQGKHGHREAFQAALTANSNVVIDRMNFNLLQRTRYLFDAKVLDYETEIIVIHEPRQVCISRCSLRDGHPTIKTGQDAVSAINMFFSKYERPTPDEADTVTFRYPEGEKDLAVICDLDGTLCNIDHRLHFVKREGKKDWKSFFEGLVDDRPNKWCSRLIEDLAQRQVIVFASGRPDTYYSDTHEWLDAEGFPTNHLYMRCRGDHRADYVAKEIILDFEILTRFKPLFFIDDRKQVVDLWRRRGFVCLACAEGEF
jgi:adenylate kinase family enzyme